MANREKHSSSHAKSGKTGMVIKSTEDRISGLPDEIILCILSLLTLKEAGRTSVLSKRWRYAWKSIPILNFYDSRLFDELISGKRDLKVEKPLYVSWVNQVLRSYQGGTIQELRVQFVLDENEGVFIDDWVQFATQKGVKRLELDLTDVTDLEFPYMIYYTFPTFSNCNSLTSLQLKYVNVTSQVIQYYLQYCPSLEYLSIEGSKALVNLKVEGHSLNLKSLEITKCANVNGIEISAPNLVSFKYFGSRISLPFVSTPKIADVSIGGGYFECFTSTFSMLSSYLSRLEALTLDFKGLFESCTKSFEFLLCMRLKRLQLRVCPIDDEDILGFSSLIKACPFLDKLRLELSWNSMEPTFIEWLLPEGSCPHNHLKVVECVGFYGNSIDMNLVFYLIHKAVVLEKLVIQTCIPTLVGTEWEFEDASRRRRSKFQAELFHDMLRPGVNLAIS